MKNLQTIDSTEEKSKIATKNDALLAILGSLFSFATFALVACVFFIDLGAEQNKTIAANAFILVLLVFFTMIPAIKTSMMSIFIFLGSSSYKNIDNDYWRYSLSLNSVAYIWLMLVAAYVFYDKINSVVPLKDSVAEGVFWEFSIAIGCAILPLYLFEKPRPAFEKI